MKKENFNQKLFLKISKEYYGIGLKSIDLLILAQIEELNRNGRPCYVTNETFSTWFGESISTVKRSIEKLRKLGIVSSQNRYIEGAGRGNKQRLLRVNSEVLSAIQQKQQMAKNSEQQLDDSKSDVEELITEQWKVHNEPIKDNIKYKEIAEGNLELIDLVLGLYKKKSKYSSIQKDVLEKYNIKLGYDDIKEIIDNRQKLNNRIEINKNDEKEKLQKQRIREYEYSCIPDTIEALERRGISVDYETIKQAYDAIQDSSFSSKWSVRDLGEWYYLSLLKEGMTFSEYTDAIHRMMDSRFDM